jgi:hypothetical protein
MLPARRCQSTVQYSTVLYSTRIYVYFMPGLSYLQTHHSSRMFLPGFQMYPLSASLSPQWKHQPRNSNLNLQITIITEKVPAV